MTREEAWHHLQLPPGSSPEQVRTQYRRLARLYHPDLSRNPGSADLFVHIRDAYELLSSQWVSRRVFERPVAQPVPVVTQMAYWGKVLRESGEAQQRAAAVRRLGRIGGAGAWVWLKSALADKSESVRSEIVRTVGTLDIRQGLGYLSAVFPEETQAVKLLMVEQAALRNFDGSWKNIHHLAMEDANPVVRWRARQLKV